VWHQDREGAQLPSKAPYSKREDAVGQACESASVRQVARQYGLAASTVRAIDLRYLERWAAARPKPALVQMGVDEIHLGKKQKFITVVSNLETGEPVWFGRERKKETLDEFFENELSRRQRMRITAVCVDMWEPFRLSLEQHVPNAKIVYDKFHVMQHANAAVDEVRRAEFFRKGGKMREVVKGKRWLLLTRWINLTPGKRQQLNQLFAMNRRVFKAYLLKESLDRLWTYHYEGAMLNYLQRWIDQLRWQRLKPFEKLHDAAGAPRRDSQLLSDERAPRSCRSHQRQPQSPTTPWSRLQEPPVSPPQSAASGRNQNRIRGVQESSLKCGSRQILAQSHFYQTSKDLSVYRGSGTDPPTRRPSGACSRCYRTSSGFGSGFHARTESRRVGLCVAPK